MVNWSDSQVIERDSLAFDRVVFCFLGVTIWELFSTWDFEWSLLQGRRKLRWPLGMIHHHQSCSALNVDSFLLLVPLLYPVGIRWHNRVLINCGALYVFNSWAGNMTLLCSSTSLMLRTIALWERKLTVVAPLGLLCIAFWTILYRTMFIVRAEWSDSARTCIVTSTEPSLLNVTFFFTMGFDLVILVYTYIALVTKHTARTDLWKLLFHDGLVYFLVTFTANCIPAVFNVLNLNTPMNRGHTAAVRAVMRLLDYTSGDVYVHSTSGVAQSSGNNATRQGPPRASAVVPKFATTRPEVLVTTEHITMSEFVTDSDSPYTKTGHSIGHDLDVEAADDHKTSRNSSECTSVV
ncbi:hypothetical protein DFH05DRAFT_1528226 [Lentinula detonsa]|uniref:Uncharacterized protein n=1 Tax=Lentinula detonsa TaxID=2804962 RepID=A0A9W8NUZ2_9AGAR|nr:hypothetical protein DFH05DRAFT_1528226 [Lentinula detonsa]